MVGNMVFRKENPHRPSAGSYRHIHINSKRVYRGKGPQSLAGDYLRSFGL